MSAKPANFTYASPQGFSYRPYAGERDLPHIINLVQTELSEPYVVYTYRYFLHGWPHLSFLAFADQAKQMPPCHSRENPSTHPKGNEDNEPEPVGVIVCKQSLHKHSARRGYIAMLSVARPWRKMGIASTLVKLSIERMVQNGADEVILETEVDNTAALGLYASLGFLREKRLFRFYMNGKDAFRLALPLPVVPSISSVPWEPLLLKAGDFEPLSSTSQSMPSHHGIRCTLSSTQSPTSTPPTDDEPESVAPGVKSRIWHVPATEALGYSDDDASDDDAWYESGR